MLIICQVLTLSRKNSYPFEIGCYIKKKRPGIEEPRWLDKEDSKKREKILRRTRDNNSEGEVVPPLPEESRRTGGMLDLD